MRITRIFVNMLLVISLCCCVPEEIILHGDISGYVTEAETSQPLQVASVNLNQSNVAIDTTSTGSDGKYILKKLTPGNYEIQASKPGYGKVTKNVNVISANTAEVDFYLNKEPFPEYSDTYLDFGMDLTLKVFTISNTGAGGLRYSISTSQKWITVDPKEGNVTTGMDTIRVTIDRTGLPVSKQLEHINILSYVGEGIQQDQVSIFANGVADQDGNYYGVVTIGTQMWLSENLNTGEMIYWSVNNRTNNDGIIWKYCYDNTESNCDIYGGLYSWPEMMDYSPPDSGAIGTTQGICPAGWHIPSHDEWDILFYYLGGFSKAGGMLKDTGTIENGTGLWKAPNDGASNESGFTALPGGRIYTGDERPYEMSQIGEGAQFWRSLDVSNEPILSYEYTIITYDNVGVVFGTDPDAANPVSSVRCIKDP